MGSYTQSYSYVIAETQMLSRLTIAPFLTASLLGCQAATPFRPPVAASTPTASPLGPSYILIPVPDDDDSLVGRVIASVPNRGHSLAEVSRPNECASALSEKRVGPLAGTYEDAQELSAGGQARAALGVFGFEGDAQTATHFYYKIDVNKRVSQMDTPEYVACCKERGSCGYGFISALIYGDGEYATAAETSASAGATIALSAGASGFVEAKVMHRRKVRGYVAALVTLNSENSSLKTSVLGDPAAAGIVLTEQDLPTQVRDRFEAQKIRVSERFCDAERRPFEGKCLANLGEGQTPTPTEYLYAFRDGSGDVTENEFVRRYRTVTGSSELADAERSRHSTAPAAIFTFASLGTAAAGGILIATRDEGDGVRLGVASGMISTGAIGFFLGLGFWTKRSGLGGYDGKPHDHSLTKFDAQLYVAKYNRALLRKTIAETKDRMRELSSESATDDRAAAGNPRTATVSPVITPGFIGLAGEF